MVQRELFDDKAEENKSDQSKLYHGKSVLGMVALVVFKGVPSCGM